MTGIATLGHLNRIPVESVLILFIAAFTLTVLIAFGSLWILHRIVNRRNSEAGLRRFSLRAMLVAVSVVAVVIGYNVSVQRLDRFVPFLYVCETEQAAADLQSIHSGSSRVMAVSLADIERAPDQYRNHNLFVIPDRLSDHEIMDQAKQSLGDVRPSPWVRVLRFPTSGQGGTVESWINRRREERSDVQIASDVWYLLNSQHQRPNKTPNVYLIHTAVLLIPPLAVLLLGLFRRVTAGNLATCSLLMWLVALWLPVLGGDLGIFALPASFLLAPAILSEGDRATGAAALLGGLANVLFLLAYAVYWRRGRVGSNLSVIRLMSTAALCCAIATAVILMSSAELISIYLGYTVWTAGLLALAIGSWQTEEGEVAALGETAARSRLFSNRSSR